jgi:hypothetical protein
MKQVSLKKGGFASRRKISRHSTSLILTIPKLWVYLSGVKEGDFVIVKIVDSSNLLVTIPRSGEETQAQNSEAL